MKSSRSAESLRSKTPARGPLDAPRRPALKRPASPLRGTQRRTV